LGWSTDFESGDALDFEFGRTFERLVRPFRIRGGLGTVPPGDYSVNEFSAMYRAFRGRKVSGNIRFETGGFFNGSQTSIDISPQFKPSQNLSFEPSYEWNKISLPDVSFTTQEFNGEVNYSFNQKWLTRTTFLLDSQDQEYTVNFRLNYIFRPGDDLFVRGDVRPQRMGVGHRRAPVSNRALRIAFGGRTKHSLRLDVGHVMQQRQTAFQIWLHRGFARGWKHHGPQPFPVFGEGLRTLEGFRRSANRIVLRASRNNECEEQSQQEKG